MQFDFNRITLPYKRIPVSSHTLAFLSTDSFPQSTRPLSERLFRGLRRNLPSILIPAALFGWIINDWLRTQRFKQRRARLSLTPSPKYLQRS